MKPYFDEVGITLYHVDAYEVVADLPGAGQTFDLVLADPRNVR